MRVRVLLLVLTALLVAACTDPVAPAVRCEGELVVTVTVTRLVTDTLVVCRFPGDTVVVPPEPPGDDDCDDPHGHGHGRHHRKGHHDHGGGQ